MMDWRSFLTVEVWFWHTISMMAVRLSIPKITCLAPKLSDTDFYVRGTVKRVEGPGDWTEAE